MSSNYAGNYNYNYNYNYGTGGSPAGGGGSFSNTPAELGLKPWALDYTPNIDGYPDLPRATRLDLIAQDFGPADWDKSLYAIRALRELGEASAIWTAYDLALDAATMPPGSTNSPAPLTGWQAKAADPHSFVTAEIDYLLALMQDDRDRYLPEIAAQADGAPLYFFGLLGLDPGQKPWTAGLTAIAARFGEMLAMHFKYEYARIRPSIICPGLLPTFGPPRHPSFPSGHSTQAHMTCEMLLQIQAIKDRYGDNSTGTGELQWLADRIAKNRERLGVHYPSDSQAGALLAQWLVRDLVAQKIVSDVFNEVLANATNEW